MRSERKSSGTSMVFRNAKKSFHDSGRPTGSRRPSKGSPHKRPPIPQSDTRKASGRLGSARSNSWRFAAWYLLWYIPMLLSSGPPKIHLNSFLLQKRHTLIPKAD